MSNWCLCSPTAGSQRGWSFDPAQDLFVCSTCRKPSKAIYMLRLSDPSAKV